MFILECFVLDVSKMSQGITAFLILSILCFSSRVSYFLTRLVVVFMLYLHTIFPIFHFSLFQNATVQRELALTLPKV